MSDHDAKIGPVGLTRAIGLLAARGDPIKLSTLSRYVAKYADALNPETRGKRTVVDFETLAEHRSQNVNREATTAARPSSKAVGRADEAALNIRAQRQMRELELAERIGAVTPTREVQDAAASAVSALKNAFALALNDTADVISKVANVEARIVRPHLRAFERRGLEAFVRVLADHGFVESPGSPDGDQASTRQVPSGGQSDA
ncbi:MAG TPA: hypothetical protein VGH40_11790 [Roseiarcus sp.]|jgi:hypothetical protein